MTKKILCRQIISHIWYNIKDRNFKMQYAICNAIWLNNKVMFCTVNCVWTRNQRLFLKSTRNWVKTLWFIIGLFFSLCFHNHLGNWHFYAHTCNACCDFLSIASNELSTLFLYFLHHFLLYVQNDYYFFHRCDKSSNSCSINTQIHTR